MSNTTPLPTSVTFGASRRPQTKSTSRGGSAAAAPTAWMSGKLRADQRVADDALVPSAPLTSASRAASVVERRGRHHVGGGIDQIAAERDRARLRSSLAKSTFAGGSSRGWAALSVLNRL